MIAKILSAFDKFDGSRSKHTMFQDWCKLTALSISNQCWYSAKREKEYLQLAGQYKNEELRLFSEMTGMLWMAFEDHIDDYLGKLYMEGNMGNKQTGQFFTPFHLAELTAGLQIEKGRPIVLNEPASGGGALILAAAKVMRENGDNDQELMQVVAQDLDWNGVYMTYIQLSMAGIVAKVIQGDALKNETTAPARILYTPMYLLKGGFGQK